MNILSFDIEEWYIEKAYHGNRKEKLSEFDRCLHNLLDKLEENNIKATFFCLGKVAKDFAYVVKCISERGHEIGCHSNEHLWLTKMTPKELEKDTYNAISALQDIIGKKVVSYRAPAFSIGEKNKWALEILAACGIERDASIFPAKRDLGGFASFESNRPIMISYNGINIKEFPVSTIRLLGKNIVYSGGGYFRFFPLWFIEYNILHSDYSMVYFHIGDMVVEKHSIPSKKEYEVYYREKGTVYNRVKRYLKSNIGVGYAEEKLKSLLCSSYGFISIEQADSMVEWENNIIYV